MPTLTQTRQHTPMTPSRARRRRPIHVAILRETAHYAASLILACALGLVAGQAYSAAALDGIVPNASAAPKDPYSQWTRTSQYVAVRDGTQLAIDIYRPAIAGMAVETRLPVILVATPYHRSNVKDGQWVPNAFFVSTLEAVLKRGYVIAFLDIRGRGASFGTVEGGVPHTDRDRRDLYDVIEWLAIQPWSDGNIGMAGCSYVGLTQFLAADVMPPHLKAIFPTSAQGWYSAHRSLCVNGVGHDSFWRTFDEMMYAMDVTTPAPPVDADSGGEFLKQAIAEHKRAWDQGTAQALAAFQSRPFRDSPPAGSDHRYGQANEWDFLSRYKTSKVAVFQYTGWRDLIPEEGFAWYRNLARHGVRQKLIIGPWYHCGWYGSSLHEATADHIRWFDRWLKGIENGVTDEPPIRYYLMGAPAGTEWRTAARWPLPRQKRKTFFLQAGNPGPGASAGGGILTTHKPDSRVAKVDYVVDYTATTENLATRWRGGTGDEPGLKPISTATLDRKSLTYTTEPFTTDAEITGFPTVELWIASTARDQDFFAYLEKVDESGVSTLITEGVIRASHRAIRRPPFDNEGLPWHASFRSDHAELLPGVPVKLEWALYPMSQFIKKGHRLRVTINNFDQGGGWDTPEMMPAPTVTLFHDAQHPSSITLPFIGRTSPRNRAGGAASLR